MWSPTATGSVATFGRLEDALGVVMARDEPYRVVRSAHDYPGVETAWNWRTGPVRRGRASITASTRCGGYADTLGPVRPEVGPYAAVDGLAETYLAVLAPDGTGGPVGRGALPASPRLWTGSASRSASDQVHAGAGIRRVRVDVGDQPRTATVDPAAGWWDGPRRPTGRPRAVDSDRCSEHGGGGEVREISFPGVEMSNSTSSPNRGGPPFHLRGARASTTARVHRRGPGRELGLRHRRAGRRGGVRHGAGGRRDRGRQLDARGCGGGAIDGRDAETSRARSWRTPACGQPPPTVSNPTWAPSWPSTVTPSASGWLHRAISGRPCACVGLNVRGAHLPWVVAPHGTAVSPQRAELTGGFGQTREVDLSRGVATFSIDGHATLGDQVRWADHRGFAATVGVAELELANLRGPGPPHRPRPKNGRGVRDFGPEVEVDGRVYPTEVTGSMVPCWTAPR